MGFLRGIVKRIFGDPNTRTIVNLQQIVQQINAFESDYRALSDEALLAKTPQFRERLEAGETLDDLLPEVFAAVREAGRRTIQHRHYDVQLIGGMILHQGRVTEMRTGEGKTLVATAPMYLNALTGKGAHLVTPNDYLAKFGVQWMGPVYHALGVSVSVIQSGGGRPDDASFIYDPDYASDDDRFQYLRPITRREAYRTDITYGTNNEFGFDYLRDNMVLNLEERTQRDLHYAIIDEVDSILIDEARTPLIISGPAEESSELYQRFARLVRNLHRDQDYEVDVKSQLAILTDEGVSKVESMVNIPEGESIYDPQHAHMLPYLDNALRASEFYQLDKEYVIRNGEVIIVDQFTGRLMFGRRYSEGLHQAIEAKEGVDVRRESLTYATITFQNFFRMYDKLSGMTGTAATEEEELRKIYDLSVIVLPTNVEYRAMFGNLEEDEVPPSEARVEFAGVLDGNDANEVTVFDGPDDERYYRRLDLPDRIYKTEKTKFQAVLQEIARLHEARRPVLVGTTAIETSEQLARLLKRHRIPHNVLNAKYHEQEALIIAQAGQPGAVTIATNMAGRGVDILLGGNPEGMARDQLRKKGVDLTEIRSADWEDALSMARRGEDPTQTYGTEWAEILHDKVVQAKKDRAHVYKVGGLHVIGTERHEARRIDNQLRGRAGRQGDPGSSRFYISLQDELMHRFGGERLQPWMDRAGLEEGALEFGMLNRAIESIHERVEGYNFDIRKHVLEYDNVVNRQREVVYAERRKVLGRDDLHDDLFDMVEEEIRQTVNLHVQEGMEDDDALLAELRRFVPIPRRIQPSDLASMETTEIVEQCVEWAGHNYWELNRRMGEERYRQLRQKDIHLRAILESDEPFFREIAERLDGLDNAAVLEEFYDQPLRRMPASLESQACDIVIDVFRLFRDRRLMVRQLDSHWVRHLTSLDMLREGIGLRAVGQQNPLVAYQKEAYETYQQMLASVQTQIVRSLFLVPKAITSSGSPVTLPTRRQLSFQTSRGSEPRETSPQPARTKEKPGRNDPCWCGSGKKYKDCHWRADRQAEFQRQSAR